MNFDPNKTYVRCDEWCVSTTYPIYNGTAEPINAHELHIYKFEGQRLIKAPCYGMRFNSSDEAREYAFNQGYLKEYVR